VASSAEPAPRKRRVRFTPDEDKLLLQYVDEMKTAGHAIKGKTIYEALAIDVRTPASFSVLSYMPAIEC
jgi:hypothetical protein